MFEERNGPDGETTRLVWITLKDVDSTSSNDPSDVADVKLASEMLQQMINDIGNGKPVFRVVKAGTGVWKVVGEHRRLAALLESGVDPDTEIPCVEVVGDVALRDEHGNGENH